MPRRLILFGEKVGVAVFEREKYETVDYPQKINVIGLAVYSALHYGAKLDTGGGGGETDGGLLPLVDYAKLLLC